MTDVYDAGALIALDRNDPEMWALLTKQVAQGRIPATHGGVVGQAWRNGARQAQLARALPALEIHPLGQWLGRRAGTLLASAGMTDVVDAALVSIATNGDVIYTSDVDEIAHLANTGDLDIEIVPV